MRKVILFIANSLDGYIARRDGSIDWLYTDQDYGYGSFFASIDTVIMGRSTYEQSLSFGEYPYPGTRAYIFSRTQTGAGDNEALFVAGAPELLVKALKNQSGKNIWLVGGGELVHAFLQQDLIDEFIISTHPLLLGDGIPLFPPAFDTLHLKLTNMTSFDTGLVQLSYIRQACT